MEVRIKFSADLIIQGDNIDEIRDKWESMELFSNEAKANGVEYCERLLVEDADTYEDLDHYF